MGKKLTYNELVAILGDTGLKLVRLEKAYNEYHANMAAEIVVLRKRVIETEKMNEKLNFLMEHNRTDFIVEKRKMPENATVSKFAIKYIQGKDLKAFEFTVKELVEFDTRMLVSEGVDILSFVRKDGTKIYYQLVRNTKVLTVITDIYNKKIAKVGGKKQNGTLV